MSTRNIGGLTQNMHRQSAVPSSGGAAKSRQLVSVAPPVLFSSSSAGPVNVVSCLFCTFAILTIFQAQLHSQLAQLSANLSDTENLLRMTSVQAEAMRGLGSWHGGL